MQLDFQQWAGPTAKLLLGQMFGQEVADLLPLPLQLEGLGLRAEGFVALRNVGEQNFTFLAKPLSPQ